MARKSKKVAILIRVTPGIRAQLRREARRHGRSLQFICEHYLVEGAAELAKTKFTEHFQGVKDAP